MEGSNPQTATPQAPPAPAPQAPKTFLQQFQDIQSLVIRHDQLLQEAEMAFSITGSSLKQLLDEVTLINDQLQAIYLLGEDGQLPTRVNVSNKVMELRVDQAKSKLAEDEAAFIIREIPEILNERSVVVYDDEKNNLSYAYKPAGKFGDKVLLELLGKKAGDVVGSVKVIKVYELISEEERKTLTAKKMEEEAAKLAEQKAQ